MRAELLDVIMVVNNPLRWESRDRLFLRTVKHMLDSGARVTVVECAYGDRPLKFQNLGENGPRWNYIGVRAKTMLWIKENLLQLGLQNLPEDWQYVSWCDADIEFKDPNWASETVEALQHFDIVQPWDHALDTGPNGEIIQVHRSFTSVWARSPNSVGKWEKGYEFAHPGFAWAATRRAMEVLGGFSLIEHACAGAGDHHLALALVKKVKASIPGHVTPGYVAPLLELEKRAARHIVENIGYLSNAITHMWHGRKEDRYYKDRWSILTSHQFDPMTDLKRNTHGVYELAGNKPGLKRDMYRYFVARREDGNVT